MSRLARIVIPGLPHHITQRGNRRAQTCFKDDDYALYESLLHEAAKKAEAEIWCYCLMPNHVHIIIVPSDKDGLRRSFADAHRRYTGYINTRMRTTDHLLGQENNLVNPKPILDRYENFSAFLNQVGDAESLKALRLSETTGRPLGDEHWLKNIEKLSGLKLTPQKRGPKAQKSNKH